jgi:hypothetical protein
MRSPIKDKPLRNPGQSFDRLILDVFLDQQVKYLIIGLLTWMSLISNWIYYFSEKPLPPFILTLIALVVFAFCYYKIKTTEQIIDPLRQGRDGEKAVGQYLKLLRDKGVKVFHDIPGTDFNLDHMGISKNSDFFVSARKHRAENRSVLEVHADRPGWRTSTELTRQSRKKRIFRDAHVLVAPSGVNVIETKTYSKPDKGQARIVYTGDTLIHHNGFKDDKPIIQVKAAANWLKQVIKESTGKDIDVKKVVLFPGWFIEPTAESKQSDVWVLNPKALPAFISNSREQLVNEDLNLVAYHLSRFVRAAV